jgi:hypothetical protein
MHYDGFVILTIPLLALVAICRDGKWHWNPVEYAYGHHRWTHALNAIVWFGWFTSLIVGTLRVCGVG